MRALTEQRIQLHIIQEIMHPAHVPLIGKTKPVILRCRRYLRPCGRFLCNDDGSILPSADYRV